MNIVFKNGQINPKYAQASQLIQACNENVREKQQALLEEYHLDQLKGYKIDEDRGSLKFILNDESTLEFEVIPLGVWNSKSNQWMWSSATANDGAIFFARSSALKKLQDVIVSKDFSEPVISCDGQSSQIFSCIATEYLGGIGRFVAPEGDFRLHFALMKHLG